MKIVVIGAGVIGVTTAYYLARQGAEVEVIDRQPGPALETSFANAGQVSPGYASPWAGPGIPRKAVKWLLMRHAPLIVRPAPDPDMYVWMLRMLANCTTTAYAINKARMVRLAEYSRDVLKALRAETGIAYDERTRGTLQLFRTQKQYDSSAKDISVLEQYGVDYELLDRKGCEEVEPGLAASKATIVGGLRLPHDETGDCHIFTNRLAELAKAMGVTFRYGVRIQELQRDGARLTGVRTDEGPVTGDAYVLAAGSFSPRLAAFLSPKLPIYPVKGYSITTPLVGEATAPVSTVLDETYKIALTRLGDRIRVGGMAELSGYSLTLSDKRRDTLRMCLDDLFPGAANTANSSFWGGLRPMTPDGTPVVGKTELTNLYVNSGHGTLGWTMACGSARVVADLVAGRKPEIDVSDLDQSRYR